MLCQQVVRVFQSRRSVILYLELASYFLVSHLSSALCSINTVFAIFSGFPDCRRLFEQPRVLSDFIWAALLQWLHTGHTWAAYFIQYNVQSGLALCTLLSAFALQLIHCNNFAHDFAASSLAPVRSHRRLCAA